jgi:hypothetical protein
VTSTITILPGREALSADARPSGQAVIRWIEAKEEYVAAFGRARAAAAVWFAFDEDAQTAATESVYEANAALGSMESVRHMVEESIDLEK